MEEEIELVTYTLDVQPTTIRDIFDFVQAVVSGFEPTLFFGITMMFGFFVAFGVRDLLLVGRRT